MIKSPVTYQGAKSRLASDIADVIVSSVGAVPQTFYEICCGSGAVSLTMVERGVAPEAITMVDCGPWGIFWREVGQGTFDCDSFAEWCARIPKDKDEVKTFMEDLAGKPAPKDAEAYVFLILQAGSFGSKAVGLSGHKWMSHGFRSYWMPTETSSRRYPVNPMMPMADEIMRRVKVIAQRMRGVTGIYAPGDTVCPPPNAAVYIDPPYEGTTGYANGTPSLDSVGYAERCPAPCYISERRPLSKTYWQLSGHRAKGGISGNRRKKAAQPEYLSLI
jgi:hypothetical protein